MQPKRIKLAVVINDFLVGGAQRLVAELLTRFDRNRFEVVLITLVQFPERESMYRLLSADVPVYKVDFKGFADVASWVALWRLLKRERPEVMLSHLFFSNTVVRVLNIFCGYKTITVEHNTYVGNTRLQVWCDRLLSRYSRRIVAVSKAVMEFASRQQRAAVDKFVVIPNGIAVDELAQAAAGADPSAIRRQLHLGAGDKYIVSVGRLTAQKDPLLLVEGFARFAAANPAHTLVFLGDGAMRAEISARAEELGIASRVRLPGNVPEVAPYCAAAEFLASTSIIEGLSMAHLEALACGLPLLATRTAGSEELIEEGKNGFYIAASTPEAVAAGMERMCESDLTALREHARATARRYDIKTATARYEEMITAVAKQK